MAGAAITTPMIVTKPDAFIGTYPIKSAEVINQGDLVGLDSNGQVVAASKTQAATVKALGIAFFEDENGMATSRTGVAALTVKTGICKKARLGSSNSTLVPALAKGLPVFLGPVPTATVSNYTCTQSTTANDLIHVVGHVDADGTTLIINVDPTNELKYQTAATSTVAYG